jgi:uncharacterized protein YgiM (DUF1202 family)
MKGFWPLLLLVASLQLSACGGSDTQATEGTDSTMVDVGGEAAMDEDAALSSWEGQSVRTAPGSGGEWVATLPFGEKLELLGETSTDEKTKKAYAKVRLLDGKDGWVREDMIQQGGILGAVTEPAQVYSRPGISNIKDETLEPASLIILGNKQDDFVEFTAQNKGNSRSKGWLLGDRAYTTEQVDITVAILLHKALSDKNHDSKVKRLNDIKNNGAYSESVFLKTIESLLNEEQVVEDLPDDQLVIRGDNVNVRSEPKVGENKLFQLSNGNVCQILEVGNYETIGSSAGYWYKISVDGKSGWVFGAFTSKASEVIGD